jgi:maleate isomerase
MMDWKNKFGIIVPSWNTTQEYELWRMAPAGVSLHFTRVTHTDDSDESLLRMVEKGPEAAQLLAHAKVDAICLGCTGASFVRPGIDVKVICEMEEATKTPCTTTSTAIKEALDHLGVKSISFATPYDERTNGMLTAFLKYSGFNVIFEKGLNTDCPAFLGPEHAYRLVREVDRKESELLLISCTNFRSLEVIEKLEKELGKPVVSSNTATMWKLFQLAGVTEKVPGAGRLLN